MQRRKFLRFGGSVVGAGLAAGCSGGGDGGSDGQETGGAATGTPTPTEPITIGELQPLSGPFTPWGNIHQVSVQFAINEINANGGVLGRDLRSVGVDTGSDPAQADSSFRRLVEEEGAVAITGPVSSDVAIRTSVTAEELGVPMVLHMGGSNDLVSYTNTFRVGTYPSTITVQALVNLIEDRNYTQIGAIIADYAWGRSVQEDFEQLSGVDINFQVAPVGADDFSSYIRKFPEDLELLSVTGHPPGVIPITAQTYELGYDPEVVAGMGYPPGVIVGALGENAFRGYTHVHNTDPYTDRFAAVGQRFGEAHDQQFNTHHGYGYVAVQIIAQAIEEAGETDPTAVRDAIRRGTFDTLFPRPIEYTRYGEVDGQVQVWSQLASGPPSYYPSGSFHLVEEFRTDPLPPLTPE